MSSFINNGPYLQELASSHNQSGVNKGNSTLTYCLVGLVVVCSGIIIYQAMIIKEKSKLLKAYQDQIKPKARGDDEVLDREAPT